MVLKVGVVSPAMLAWIIKYIKFLLINFIDSEVIQIIH